MLIEMLDGLEGFKTGRVLKDLPVADRRQIAQAFIGFVCQVEFEGCVTLTLAVEGIASSPMNGTASDQLIATRGANIHDLSQFEAYSLATIRSIKTVKRF